MKKKALPGWVQNPLLAGLIQSRAGIILSYWLFQGMLYMDNRERAMKIALDIMMVVMLCILGVSLPVSLFLAHTLNMFINGHFFAMRRHMGIGKNDPKEFIDYIEALHNRIQQKRFLLGAAAYGSLSRNVFRVTSDIDIRVFPEKGAINWLKTVLWIFAERFRALMLLFPLDIYAFELEVIDTRMRTDEPPIIFLDEKKKIIGKYPDNVPFKQFAHDFRLTYLQSLLSG